MGQHLSNTNSQIAEFVKSNRATVSSATNLYGDNQEEVDLFLPTLNKPNFEPQCTKRIQKSLFVLTNVSDLKMLSAQIGTTLLANVRMSLLEDEQRIIFQIKSILDRQKQLKLSFKKKLDEDKKRTNVDEHEQQVEEILLKWSSATIRFKNILPLLDQLMRDTVNIYDVRDILIEFTNNFERIYGE